MIFLLFMTAGFVTYFFVYTKQPSIQGDIINNGMDMHGCLVSEGYNWNETEKSCVNDWLTSKYQVVDFQTCKAAGYAISENNETKYLQCQALNGTIFADNSPEFVNNNSADVGNGNTTFVGNFTINQTAGNQTNLTVTNNS